MKIEICANSFASAQAAQAGGASRIELCENLSVGGLTPSYYLIERVFKELDIPVHVLIRPRSGDFIYTTKEINRMLNSIAFCKKIGCTGVVSGALTSERTIDTAATKRLIETAKGMEFTFHRAFDCVIDPVESVSLLLNLGVTRLLSSGQQNRAVDGLDMLKKLKILSKGGLQIMPGSGINSENAIAFKNAGFKTIHFSATKKINTTKANAGLFSNEVIGTSDEVEIRRIIKILS